MKIYNVLSLEEGDYTYANVKAFKEQEKAKEYAEKLLKEWEDCQQEYSEDREEENRLSACNDSYSIGIYIKEEEI